MALPSLGGGTYDVSVTAHDPLDTTTARTLSLSIDGKSVASGALTGGSGTVSKKGIMISPGKHTLAVNISPTLTSAQGDYTGAITFKPVSLAFLPKALEGKPINYSAGATGFSATVFAGLGRVIVPPSLGGGTGGAAKISIGKINIGQQTIKGTITASNPQDPTTSRQWILSVDGKQVESSSAQLSGSSLPVHFTTGLGKHTLALAIQGGTTAYVGNYTATLTVAGIAGRSNVFNFSPISATKPGSASALALPLGKLIPPINPKLQDISGLRAGIGATNPINRIIGGLPNEHGPYVHQSIGSGAVPYIDGGRENALYAATIRQAKGVTNVPGWGDGAPNVEVGRRQPKSMTSGISDIAILRR